MGIFAGKEHEPKLGAKLHINVSQDGADFYFDTFIKRGVNQISAPMTVGDQDQYMASLARKWFTEYWCPDNGIEPHFNGVDDGEPGYIAKRAELATSPTTEPPQPSIEGSMKIKVEEIVKRMDDLEVKFGIIKRIRDIANRDDLTASEKMHRIKTTLS